MLQTIAKTPTATKIPLNYTSELDLRKIRAIVKSTISLLLQIH